MATPDYRIKLPAPKIDFDSLDITTNIDIDDYPPAGGQARYDHMRSVILGLLANQASFNEPTQYKEGSQWFDLNLLCLKIRKNNAWVTLADAIAVSVTDGVPITLSDWYASVAATIGSLTGNMTFSGSAAANNITNIPIPNSLRSSLTAASRPTVYVNGLLLDPRKTNFTGSPPSAIGLASDVALANADTFTVLITSIPTAMFYSPTVLVS